MGRRGMEETGAEPSPKVQVQVSASIEASLNWKKGAETEAISGDAVNPATGVASTSTTSTPV